MPLIDYKNLPHQRIWPGITGSIFHSEKATIGHIHIEEGILLPTHQHPHEQWSHVIEGVFEFVLGDEKIVLEAGASVYIPPHLPHSGKAITACKIIDCFVPPRDDWKSLPFVTEDHPTTEVGDGESPAT
ncbi:MAG TPA: cupin domain-containing protein [Saprospiraceae bacterium]|nr:cupin domain-containing protein [Saprospiraceae bacterium]